MKNFMKIIYKYKTTKQCCQINEILTLLCNNYCIQCKGTNNMKKTIMMILSSVIALSCANFDTYATDTAQPERKRDKVANFLKKLAGSKFTKSMISAGKSTVATQLNADAAAAELAGYQAALSANINNLETKCTQLMPQGADANNAYSKIINELAQLKEHIRDDQFNNFYPQANANILKIIDLCNSTAHQPVIEDATSIKQCFDNILQKKGLSITTTTPAEATTTATPAA